MHSFKDLLSQTYFHNTIREYLIACAILITGWLLLAVFKHIILRGAGKLVGKTTTTLDDLILENVKKFVMPILGTAILYWSVSTLTLSDRSEKVLTIATGIVIAYFVIRVISSIIEMAITHYIRKQDNGEEKVKQVGGIMILINIMIWILGTIFLIDNLGYNVSTILTGVGIGGIAIALAAQNIIGDLFNYFVIFFDKPFEVGDAIKVDDKNGTIEFIGIKTTRLRSLAGEQIIIANSDLTKSRVHNFKRQENRRIEFTFNVLYRTPVEKLRTIPELLKGIIENIPNAKFDRAHIGALSEYGLQVVVVYFVTVPSFIVYMDIQQAINLRILETFQQEGIIFQIREDKEFTMPGEKGNSENTPASPKKDE